MTTLEQVLLVMVLAIVWFWCLVSLLVALGAYVAQWIVMGRHGARFPFWMRGFPVLSMEHYKQWCNQHEPTWPIRKHQLIRECEHQRDHLG